MTILSRLGNWLAGNANRQSNGTQNPTPSTSAHDDAPIVGFDSALQVSTVWACVMLLVENIASLPLFTFATDESGSRTKMRGSRFFDVLHRTPNVWQTSQEFWEQMLLNYFLRGNCYALLIRDKFDEVIAMWPLSADQVQVKVLGNKLWYVYTFENTDYIYELKQILHIKGPGNGLIGLSALDYMRASVGLAIKAQNHTNKTFTKEARRPGVLMYDGLLTKDQRAALKENFKEITNGGERELFVLEAQMKFEPLGMSPADIQLLESRQFSVQDLARWLGVPSVLINDTGETTALGSSVETIINGFFKLKLRPQLTRLEQALEKRVLNSAQRARNITIEFGFDALLRANLKDRVEVAAKKVQNGLATRNEARRLENEPPLAGGDVLTVQSNLLPIELLGKVKVSGTPPEQPIEQ